MEKHQQILAATMILWLKEMDNTVIAVANNGLCLYGHVQPTSLAYQPMLDAGLIKENGEAVEHDALVAALCVVINERVADGSWG